jgi:hypothetical protein
LLELQGLIGNASAEMMARIACDSTVAGSYPTLLELDATVPAPAGIGTLGAYITATINGVQSFFMAYNGQTFWKNPLTGVPYFSILDTQELVGAAGQGILQIEPVYNAAIPTGLFADIVMSPKLTAVGGSVGLAQIFMTPVINLSGGGTGNVTGILYDPDIVALGGELIAYENTIGDVKLQSDATTGRTGIHNSGTLSAWLHLGPGVGVTSAGTAPLKFTAGPLLTVPESGAMEFDGTHLYFTIGIVRSIIV